MRAQFVKTTDIRRSALVLYSDRQMYDLVNDVASYPLYMDGCERAEIISWSEHEMVAKMWLKKAGIGTSFTTRNRLRPPHSIELTLAEGPFSAFHGLWQFQALDSNACKVSLEMEFALNSSVFGAAVGMLFAKVADNMVSALIKRAQTVYGAHT